MAIVSLLLAFTALPLSGSFDLGSSAGTRFSCSCAIRMPCCLAQRCPLGSSSHRGGAQAAGSADDAPTLHSCHGGEAAHLVSAPSLPALPLPPCRMAIATVATPASAVAEPSAARTAGDVEVPPPRTLPA